MTNKFNIGNLKDYLEKANTRKIAKIPLKTINVEEVSKKKVKLTPELLIHKLFSRGKNV